MKSTNQVVYKPLTKPDNKVVNAPTKIEEPSYPDKGTAYAGFSKKLMSQNTYRLDPQEQFDQNGISIFPAGTTTTSISITNDSSKNLYITRIIMFTLFGAINRVNIGDTSNGKIFLAAGINTSTSWIMQSFDFGIPIKINSNSITMQLNAGAVAGDTIILNTYGWAEAQ